MMIVEPDFARHVDVPGTGPCRRPVDIDHARIGFHDLVSLRVYAFDAGMVVNGEAEEDEVFIVLMRGSADIHVDSADGRSDDFALDADRGARAIYMPPHAHYRLTAGAPCDVAYARARPVEGATPHALGFTATNGKLEVGSHATAMGLSLRTMAPGGSVSFDDHAPERFVHLRSDAGGTAVIAGRRLGDWQSVALGSDEAADMGIEGEQVDVLTINAVTR